MKGVKCFVVGCGLVAAQLTAALGGVNTCASACGEAGVSSPYVYVDGAGYQENVCSSDCGSVRSKKDEPKIIIIKQKKSKKKSAKSSCLLNKLLFGAFLVGGGYLYYQSLDEGSKAKSGEFIKWP